MNTRFTTAELEAGGVYGIEAAGAKVSILNMTSGDIYICDSESFGEGEYLTLCAGAGINEIAAPMKGSMYIKAEQAGKVGIAKE